MNLIQRMMQRVKTPYVYTPGIVAGVGVGVEGLGFVRHQSLPLDGIYDRRKTVQGDLGPIEGGVMKLVQDVTPVGIAGNGAYTTGALALQALAEFQAGQR